MRGGVLAGVTEGASVFIVAVGKDAAGYVASNAYCVVLFTQCLGF